MTRDDVFAYHCKFCIMEAQCRKWHFEIVPVKPPNSGARWKYYAAIRNADSAVQKIESELAYDLDDAVCQLAHMLGVDDE